MELFIKKKRTLNLGPILIILYKHYCHNNTSFYFVRAHCTRIILSALGRLFQRLFLPKRLQYVRVPTYTLKCE